MLSDFLLTFFLFLFGTISLLHLSEWAYLLSATELASFHAARGRVVDRMPEGLAEKAAQKSFRNALAPASEPGIQTKVRVSDSFETAVTILPNPPSFPVPSLLDSFLTTEITGETTVPVRRETP